MKKVLLFFCIITITSGCGRKTAHARPERRDITETVFASGTLEPDNKYNLTAQTDGYINALKFDDGDTVKTGQLLASIDNKQNSISAASSGQLLSLAAENASAQGPTLTQARQNIELMKEKATQDSILNQRYKKLYQINSVSKLEMENAGLNFETSRTNRNNAIENYKLMQQQTEQQLIAQRSQRDINSVSGGNNEIRAVVGGKVYKRLKELGDFVRRGDIIAVIGDASELFAKLSIDESNISKVRLKQEAIVQLNTRKEKNYIGFVSEIYPSFDEASQSFFCKVRFKEKPEFTFSGTQLQANIIVAQKKQVLTIPRKYLGYGNTVQLKDGKEAHVQTGFISGEYVEVLGGIDENAELVTEDLK